VLCLKGKVRLTSYDLRSTQTEAINDPRTDATLCSLKRSCIRAEIASAPPNQLSRRRCSKRFWSAFD
jgi:hypothetical protein